MNSSEYDRHKELLEEMVASQSVDLVKARSSLDPDITARGKVCRVGCHMYSLLCVWLVHEFIKSWYTLYIDSTTV